MRDLVLSVLAADRDVRVDARSSRSTSPTPGSSLHARPARRHRRARRDRSTSRSTSAATSQRVAITQGDRSSSAMSTAMASSRAELTGTGTTTLTATAYDDDGAVLVDGDASTSRSPIRELADCRDWLALYQARLHRRPGEPRHLRSDHREDADQRRRRIATAATPSRARRSTATAR